MKHCVSYVGGVSLIELLVSILLFSSILLGLGKLATQTMFMSHSAYLYSFASQQANNIGELLRITSIDEATQQQFNKLLPEGAIDIQQRGATELINVSWYDKFQLHAKDLGLKNIQLMVMARQTHAEE